MKNINVQFVYLTLVVLAIVLGNTSNATAINQSPAIGIEVSSLVIGPGAAIGIANYNGSGVLVGGKIIDDTATPLGYEAAENRLATYIEPRIQTGYNGGNWLGTTGFTDPAAAADYKNYGGEVTAVAAVVNADLGLNGGSEYTTFAGQTAEDNSILIAHTWVGDTNLDGVIDMSDYYNVLFGFENQSNPIGGPPGWAYGDFTGSGSVTAQDFELFWQGVIAQNEAIAETGAGEIFPENGAQAPTSWPSGLLFEPAGLGVPEPGTLALLLAGVCLAVGRVLIRRRRGQR